MTENERDLRNLVGYFSRRYGLEFDELMNETWLRLHEYNYHVLSRAVHHASVSLIRKNARHDHEDISVTEAPMAAPDTSIDDLEQLRWMLRNVEPFDAQVALCFAEGYRRREITEALNATISEVEAARRRLKRSLSTSRN